MLLAGCAIGAQVTATQAPGGVIAPEAARLEEVPRVPGVGQALSGLNAGITFAGVHDSGIGWYNVMTPAVSYTFSRHYSVDASASLYPYRLAPNPNTDPADKALLVQTRWNAGDTWIGTHASFTPGRFLNTTTGSMTLPSGNRRDSLSTGRVTFDASDHVERYFGNLGALLDVGGGDSSALFNRLVMQDYASLGPLAHFQAGFVYWFKGRSYIQSLAYEQLPIGDQKTYTTIGGNGRGPSFKVVTGRNVPEDNGFTTSTGVHYPSTLRFRATTIAACACGWILFPRASHLCGRGHRSSGAFRSLIRHYSKGSVLFGISLSEAAPAWKFGRAPSDCESVAAFRW